MDGAAVYRAMAASERDPSLATVYVKLAEAEERHGALWEAKLREAKSWRGVPAPSWRARVLTFAARRAGASFVASTLAGREANDQGAYDDQAEAGTALPRDERSPVRVLREISGSGMGGPAIARLEVPIVPLIFLTRTEAIVASAALAAAALFGVGALITVVTGQPALQAGLRQLGIGVAAAAITFAVERLVGVALG